MKLLAGQIMLDCTAPWAHALPDFLASMGASIQRATVADAISPM